MNINIKNKFFKHMVDHNDYLAEKQQDDNEGKSAPLETQEEFLPVKEEKEVFSEESSVENQSKVSETQQLMIDIKQEFLSLKSEFADIKKDVESIKTNLTDVDFYGIRDSINNIKLTFSDIYGGMKKDIALTDQIGSDIKDFKNLFMSKIVNLDEISNIIKQLDGISGITEKLNIVNEAVGNIDYNIRQGARINGNQDTQYTQMLQDKLTVYESDLHLKLMRKYVIDNQITLHRQISTRINYMGESNEFKNVLKIIEECLENIGVKTLKSKEGDSFNPRMMTTGKYENTSTSDEQLNGKVAESKLPGFVWTLPTIGKLSPLLVLKEEEVTLYEYSQE